MKSCSKPFTTSSPISHNSVIKTRINSNLYVDLNYLWWIMLCKMSRIMAKTLVETVRTWSLYLQCNRSPEEGRRPHLHPDAFTQSRLSEPNLSRRRPAWMLPASAKKVNSRWANSLGTQWPPAPFPASPLSRCFYFARTCRVYGKRVLVGMCFSPVGQLWPSLNPYTVEATKGAKVSKGEKPHMDVRRSAAERNTQWRRGRAASVVQRRQFTRDILPYGWLVITACFSPVTTPSS